MTDTPISIPTQPEPDLSGQTVGDYVILRRLGRGGMAEVYLAHQQSLDRPVAFKVLKQSLAGDTNYIRRFQHEARAAANLAHANIVQIYEVGSLESIHFIAQEYVKGQNVKHFLARHGAIDLFLAYNIMRQVSAALLKAGEQGVIHRDIKPENIMLAANGEVKVADFGLARVTRSEQSTDLTQIGITLGTPLYMSPEQVEGSHVDPRSDIYSFGVTCYEMLSGRPPYEGDTALAVAVKHLNDEPTPLERIRPDLPTELCAIIRKMMEKKAVDRYQSATEMILDLRQLQVEETDDKWAETLHQLSLTDRQQLSNTRTAQSERLGRLMLQEIQATRFRWMPWVGIAMVIIAMGFGGGILLSQMNPPVDLLHVDPASRDQVPQQESAEEQYRLAFQLRTEQAWLAVAELFPEDDSNQNRYYGQLSRVRLGEYYIREERLEDALQIFDSLQQVGAIEREFQLMGFAGSAIVYDRLNDEENSRRVMVQFDRAFEEFQNESFNTPPSWRDFFDDNDYIRSMLEQLREKLAWDESDSSRPINGSGS